MRCIVSPTIRREAMDERNDPTVIGIDRRDLVVAGIGVVALAASMSGRALAQAGPVPTATSPSVSPGTVVIERRGPVLFMGVHRQPRNLLDAPLLIGLVETYYQLYPND